MNRLRGLNRRIQRATGSKRRFLEREYDLTYRSLGRLTWVSSPPPPTSGLDDDPLYLKPKIKIDGTYKKQQL